MFLYSNINIYLFTSVEFISNNNNNNNSIQLDNLRAPNRFLLSLLTIVFVVCVDPSPVSLSLYRSVCVCESCVFFFGPVCFRLIRFVSRASVSCFVITIISLFRSQLWFHCRYDKTFCNIKNSRVIYIIYILGDNFVTNWK